MRTRLWWLVAGVIALAPRSAAAQAVQATDWVPRVSVGAGAGLAIPFHGDFDFTAGAWEADVRVAAWRHVVFEVAVGEWRHTDTATAESIRVTSPAGTIGNFWQETNRVQRMIQVNALFSASKARLRATAGGGVGLLQHERRRQQETTNCTPGVSCGSSESRFSNEDGTAQAIGGVEVRVVGGLAVYGQVRFVVPMGDPAGADLRFTTGVRWGFGGL